VKIKRAWMAAALIAAATLSSANVEAASWKERQQAQKLGKEAKGLAKQGKFKKAAKKYKKADELTPAPSYKLELARMLVALEDLVQAAEVVDACVEKQPRQWVEKVAFKKCQDLAVELEDRIPTIEISVFEPSAELVEVTVDGEDYDPDEGAVSFNPGEVEVEASADGYAPYSKTVKLPEGKNASIEISMEKAGPKEDAVEEDEDSGGLSPVWAYASWGLGAVGIGVGVGFGVAAITSTNELLRVYECEDGVCPAEAQDDLDRAKLNGNVSTVGFVVGFVGVTAGTILFLLSGDDSDESDSVDEELGSVDVSPMLGPGFVGVQGTF
jgi:tetratricopeptide (TPR) repeat protein